MEELVAHVFDGGAAEVDDRRYASEWIVIKNQLRGFAGLHDEPRVAELGFPPLARVEGDGGGLAGYMKRGRRGQAHRGRVVRRVGGIEAVTHGKNADGSAVGKIRRLLI